MSNLGTGTCTGMFSLLFTTAHNLQSPLHYNVTVIDNHHSTAATVGSVSCSGGQVFSVAGI